jgi:hypothetical protein
VLVLARRGLQIGDGLCGEPYRPLPGLQRFKDRGRRN